MKEYIKDLIYDFFFSEDEIHNPVFGRIYNIRRHLKTGNIALLLVIILGIIVIIKIF